MNHYVDGFILTVPKDKLATYRKLARKASHGWREHGALEFRECVDDDMEAGPMLPFPKFAKAKPDEIVIFSYIVSESRKHRDAANKKILSDPKTQAMCAETEGVFDCKRMAYGGCKSFVHA
jgi:uncharacterized protein YbaA (DUF1428 family)